jgi:hypothetical protein
MWRPRGRSGEESEETCRAFLERERVGGPSARAIPRYCKSQGRALPRTPAALGGLGQKRRASIWNFSVGRSSCVPESSASQAVPHGGAFDNRVPSARSAGAQGQISWRRTWQKWFRVGEGDRFTIYSRTVGNCAASGGSVYSVQLESGIVEAGTGNLLDRATLNVVISIDSEFNCPSKYSARGDWGLGVYNLTEKQELNELVYMCVGETDAYVPNETWRGEAGLDCRCETDFSVHCE